jgi:hypothetical protein
VHIGKPLHKLATAITKDNLESLLADPLGGLYRSYPGRRKAGAPCPSSNILDLCHIPHAQRTGYRRVAIYTALGSPE